MSVSYAPIFIEELFARRDLVGLHTLISARSRTREMPDVCKVFCRVLEWSGSTRSGVWQYYEGLKEEDFAEVCRLLTKFGMDEVLARYREGRNVWKSESAIAVVDRWIDDHEGEIHETIFTLLKSATEELKKNEG
jgi:hypothetical protein